MSLVNYKIASKVAVEILNVIKDSDYTQAAIICGSLRRFSSLFPPQAEFMSVHDIDIVYVLKDRHINIPKGWFTREIADRLLDARVIKAGNDIGQIEVGGINVDLFRSDFNALPSVVMMRTGSQGHNVIVAQRARSLGFKWAYGTGIVNSSGEVIAPVNWYNPYSVIFI